MDTRILIAVILSLAVVFAYQEFVVNRLFPPQQHEMAKPGSPTASGKASEAATPLPPPASAKGAVGTLAAGQSAPVRSFTVQTDDYIARLSTEGGRLESLQLTHFHETAAPTSPLMELVSHEKGAQLPLALVVEKNGRRVDDRDVVYRTSAPSEIVLHGNRTAVVEMTATTAGGLTLTKTLKFRGDSYVFDLNATVAGPPAQVTAAGLALTGSLTRRVGYENIPEAQTLVNGKAAVDAEKALKKGVAPLTGKITYVGLGDLYFLAAFLPRTPQVGTVGLAVHEELATAMMLFGASGGRATIDTQVYVGPKELTTLEAVNPELRRAINFGWTGILALAFLRALKLFHHITPNYGVDIILLTVAIRVLFLPMSIKSQRSMMRLQRLQPQVERLRDKFKDDRERLNREMVDLYKRNHVNPLGGCAPMLLQLPIFFGLYEALINSIELRHAPFIGWIRDLSAPECLVIPGFPQLPFMPCGGLPVLVLMMGASTWLQQYLSPQAADPSQQKMMMLMPLVFTVMFLNLPAGLSLYYFASNVLGIIQQYFLNREFKQMSTVNP